MLGQDLDLSNQTFENFDSLIRFLAAKEAGGGKSGNNNNNNNSKSPSSRDGARPRAISDLDGEGSDVVSHTEVTDLSDLHSESDDDDVFDDDDLSGIPSLPCLGRRFRAAFTVSNHPSPSAQSSSRRAGLPGPGLRVGLPALQEVPRPGYVAHPPRLPTAPVGPSVCRPLSLPPSLSIPHSVISSAGCARADFEPGDDTTDDGDLESTDTDFDATLTSLSEPSTPRSCAASSFFVLRSSFFRAFSVLVLICSESTGTATRRTAG